LNGINDWKLGDWVIFNGTTWDKVDNTDSVISVNGFTGAVSLTTDNISEGSTNLYYTNARVRGAISLTTSGTSGAATYDNGTGVLNIPNYGSALSGYVTLDTTQTITGLKTFTSSGSANTIIVNHTSGSGHGIDITKAGSGEGLRINKTSGSGNAASITGGITLLSELNLTTKLADAHINSAATWNAKIGGSGTTNYLAKFTASGTVGNSLIYDNGTNVGIGSTSPSGNLHVKAPSGSAIFRIEDGGGNSIGRLQANAGDGSLNLFQQSNYDLTFGTNNTERMRITSGGNVGIGTTSPAEKLQVNGNILVSSGSYKSLTSGGFGNIGFAPGKIGSTSFGGLFGPAITYNAQYNGSIWQSIGGGNASAITIDEGVFSFANSQGVGAGGVTLTWTDRLVITSSGNVGIGTTSPQAKLHSNSDILTGYFQNGTNGIYDALKLTNNTASNTLSGNGARIQFYNNTNNSTNLLGSSIRSVNVDYGWASDLVLSSVQNNGYASQTVNDAVWIKANGNVGIGTASPAAKLDVNGDIYSRTGFGIYANTYSPYSGNMTIALGGSGNNLLITGGNVGIGTTSPARKLVVSGSGVPFGVTSDNNQYLMLLEYSGGSSTSYIGTTSNGLIFAPSSASEAMRITSSGNVGIGTTSPAYKLDVNGNVRVTGTMTATLGGFNSDINDKTDLVYGAKSNVLDLNAVSYLRKSTNSKEYGYIAQDVKKVLPEAVYETVSGLAVSYHMVNAAKIQALQEEIKELKAKLLSK
jgi:hypothetical protein